MTVIAKKILFVLPSLLRAGAETQVIDLVNSLDSTKFKKYLLTFEANLDQYDRIDHDHVKFIHHPRRYKFDFGVIREIARIIDEERIDLVHCSLQIALFMSLMGVKFSKRKPSLVLAVHTTVNVSRHDEWFDKFFYQWLMRICSKVIFVCGAQKTYWQSKYPFLRKRSQVIYNGVDTDYFAPAKFLDIGLAFRGTLGIPEEGRVICHIAGFRPEKGHTILLNAFSEVLKAVPNAYLVFAGDGPLRVEITHLVQEMGIEERVRFLGSLADVRPVLAASDVSVLSSTAVETFSIAMLESMSMKVPMVATDMGGTSEAVLHDETGVIVEPGDQGGLAKALANLLIEDRKRIAMGDAARTLVKNKFTKRNMVEETASVIEQCISIN
ncbi:glycosyltransferase family 4 protein [Sulfurirhabdus autotrophica]|uniref:Glycosyltransferase involved in cell wall biosynthesis n=1 Tax=Sulfurirhabdus autotrophica TaxID=1706046 RepID=A0A4R3XW62_9PROT|nr:glycosyltransferase family 4 protein [Sulfurirhabdus autotrophica]TCV83440.1 glycosyltransferase involved in cell wall biosynthesis [Sulfurirhabdus autotrophica]